MLHEILILLVSTAAKLYTGIVLLRLYMQLARVDFYNPIAQFVIRVSDPPLKPLRRVVPGLWGIDCAALLLALLLQFVAAALLLSLKGVAAGAALYAVISVLGVLTLALDIAFFTLVATVVISWVAPQSHHPAPLLLRQLGELLLAPFRRLLPLTGGLDFSPMLALFVIHVLRSIVLPGLLGP